MLDWTDGGARDIMPGFDHRRYGLPETPGCHISFQFLSTDLQLADTACHFLQEEDERRPLRGVLDPGIVCAIASGGKTDLASELFQTSAGSTTSGSDAPLADVEDDSRQCGK